MNTKVTSVDYSGPKVIVNSQDLLSGEFNQIEADYVVVTVSIGVLKSNLITFIPEFPLWKKKALDDCYMVVFSKIFMKFECVFWEDDMEYIYIANDKDSYYP